jgi:hypothetical protein
VAIKSLPLKKPKFPVPQKLFCLKLFLNSSLYYTK